MDGAMDIESETDDVSEQDGDGLEDGSDTVKSDDDDELSDNQLVNIHVTMYFHCIMMATTSMVQPH